MKPKMGARSTTASTNRASSSTSNTTRPRAGVETIVDLLVASGRPKAWAERALAEMAQGIVTCMAASTISVFDAWDELFNITNYRAIKRHRLSRHLAELFEWGMELSTIARTVPDSLPESFSEMTRLANLVMQSRRRTRAA
jgi:hypothetical protein